MKKKKITKNEKGHLRLAGSCYLVSTKKPISASLEILAVKVDLPCFILKLTTKIKLCGRPPQYAPALCKLTFDLDSGARDTSDVGYLCANFSIPMRFSVLYL